MEKENSFKNISNTEVRKRALATTPLIFDREFTSESVRDWDIFNQEDSRNFGKGNNNMIDPWWRNHPVFVSDNGFWYYHNNIGGRWDPDFWTWGKLMKYLKKNWDNKGTILRTTNTPSLQRSERLKKVITKIKQYPEKNFIIFRPNGWGFDLYKTPEQKIEKQKLITKLHELSTLPNVIISITATDNSPNRTIVSEDETPWTNEYQEFPVSVNWRRWASSSNGQWDKLWWKMPQTSKKVPVLLARHPKWDSSSESCGDVAGQIFNIWITFPHLNKNSLNEVLLNPKNAVPVTTQEGKSATEIQLDMNKIVFNELLPNGMVSSLSLGDKVEVLKDNQWIAEENIFVQGVLVVEEKGKYYLDTKLFAQRGGFTKEDGTLAKSVETTIEINLPKRGEEGKFLFQKKFTITVNR